MKIINYKMKTKNSAFIKIMFGITLMSLALGQPLNSTQQGDKEKKRFIYGQQGDSWFNQSKSAHDILRLEQMWSTDL